MISYNIFQHFFNSEKAGSVLLFAGLAASLVIANSAAAPAFNNLLAHKIGFASLHLDYSLSVWINDGLMAVFFLLVGLEIKRELLKGELSEFKKAALPVFAATGGMVVPAIIYALFNAGTSASGGWGIPMATDIAFALAVIGLLSKKVPASLKIFLAALAIVDDLGAILVIAVFYTSEIHQNYLLLAGLTWALLLLFNYFRLRHLILYLIPGLFLWYFLHHSGIHATIAGVLLAFAIPLHDKRGTSPLEKLEHQLTRPVNYVIMPVFALANTNITFQPGMIEGLGSSLGAGIIAGLFVGKTIGVSLFSWLAVRLKIARLPHRAHWKHIIGLGMLAGIGFTMSVFIALLSFTDTGHMATAKFAILCASLLSGLTGYFFLKQVKPI